MSEEVKIEADVPQRSLEDLVTQLVADNRQLTELVQSLHSKLDTLASDVKEMKDLAAPHEKLSPRGGGEHKKPGFKNIFNRKGKAGEQKKNENKKEESREVKKETEKKDEKPLKTSTEECDVEVKEQSEEGEREKPAESTDEEEKQPEAKDDDLSEENERSPNEEKPEIKEEAKQERNEENSDAAPEKQEEKNDEAVENESEKAEEKEKKEEKTDEKKAAVGRGRSKSVGRAPVIDETEGPILLEGELLKQGVRGIKSWKKRKFVLQNSNLRYFDRSKETGLVKNLFFLFCYCYSLFIYYFFF